MTIIAPLDPTALFRLRAVASRVQWRESSGSTNAELVAAAGPERWPHLGVLLTDQQVAGRGRLGRDWVAPAHSSLAVSILLRPSLPLESWGWLSMIGGTVLVDALTRAFRAAGVAATPTLKWPNDVLVDGRKLCGILAEVVLDAGGSPAVVVGFGLNTAMTAEQLPVDTATSLAVLGADLDLDALLADLVLGLDQMLTRLENADGDAAAAGIVAAVSDACGTLGTAVRVELPGGSFAVGTATRLGDAGALVIARPGEPDLIVTAGDVIHLRPAPGRE